MASPGEPLSLDDQIDLWRRDLRARQAVPEAAIAPLEARLRQEAAALAGAGLASDEAFLVAVKRLGGGDEHSRAFAREHGDRLWQRVLLEPPATGGRLSRTRTDAILAVGLAVAAAAAIKLPALFGITLAANGSFYARNLSFFVLPLLTLYFVWKRGLRGATLAWVGAPFLVAAAVVNGYPFAPDGSTEVLAALHLPIALVLVVGVAHAGGRWGEVAGRMDFIRFAGELFIHYVLIALGGGVLMGFMAMIFQAIGIDIEPVFESWILPCGAAGAVLIAAWLAETRQGMRENIAPVLARLFTPLFAVALLTFLGVLIGTGRGIAIEREMLIAFDLLLVVVLGLILYAMSARDRQAPPGGFDALQLVLVVSALVVDAVALSAIAARISEYGLTPNRVAALGMNLILLVNLAWSAVLQARFLRGRASFTVLERWQTNYLPVYAAWAALVVIAFPPLFRYL